MADASTSGGLMGNIDPDLLINLGAGLMSGAKLGSSAGEGLLQGMASYRAQKQSKMELAQGQQSLQSGAINLQRQKMMMDAAQAALANDPSLMGGSPAQSGAPAQSPPGNSAQAPQGLMQPPNPAPPQMPSSMTPPSMSQVYGTTYPGGMSPNYTRAMAMFSPDPVAALSKSRADQLALAQQNYAPALAKMDTVIKSDKPSQYVAADPELSDAWKSLAVAHGFDPVKDASDANMRTAFSFGRNALASSIGKDTAAPPVALQNITLSDGRKAQVEPGTGKETILPDADLQSVMGMGGPTLVPRAKAAGMTPFNPTIFGASNLSDQAKDLAYQQWKVNGGQMPTGFSRNPIMGAQLLDYFAQRAKSEGLTGLSVVAQGQQTKAAQGVVKDYTSGATAKTLNGLNTAVAHMDALDPLIENLNNTSSPAFNKVANFFKSQTGSPAPTNYAAIKEFVGGEVAKAVLPGGGGEAERAALTAPLNAANSPEQLRRAVQQIKVALAGKTEALRNQWDVGTNGNQGSFDKFLLPPTKRALGLSTASDTAHPQNIQALLDKYK